MSNRLVTETRAGPLASPPTQSGPSIVALIVLACGAVPLLYARSLAFPVLFYDDFQILAPSRTWERTRDSLWVPMNEHAMPLGRLFCFALEYLAGRLPILPFVTALVGPVSLLLGMLLVFVFVRRELGHTFYSLLALVLFGVTTVYHQDVWWFAGNFAILVLDTLLLGLLAAQRWRQTGRGIYLDLTVLACLLAPGWSALGVLAGPLCCLYLIPKSECRMQNETQGFSSLLHSASCILHSRLTLTPLLGTALFLAVSLPRTAETILHSSHYGHQTAVEAFQPLVGLRFTSRSIVDNLLLGIVGVAGVEVPLGVVIVVLVLVVALMAWWWWQALDRRLMLLGLGLIGSSYLLIYSARANWGYAQMTQPSFSRYHLLPHLGLVLFFCGGLPGCAGRWFALNEDGTLTLRQRRLVLILIGACFLIQLPRGLLCGAATGWTPLADLHQQFDVLRRIEKVDAQCRKHHISASAARQVLGRLDIPLSQNVIDGWDFLRGSDDPHPRSPEEVKCLLNEP